MSFDLVLPVANAVNPEPHAVWRSDSTRLNHLRIWFQLVKIWVTTLRGFAGNGLQTLSVEPNGISNRLRTRSYGIGQLLHILDDSSPTSPRA